MGVLALVWLLAWPGLVAPLANLPSWFAQVGLVDPAAVSLGLAGGAVDVLLAWSGGVGAVNPHPALLVVVVLVGLLACSSGCLLCCFGRQLGCPPSDQRQSAAVAVCYGCTCRGG